MSLLLQAVIKLRISTLYFIKSKILLVVTYYWMASLTWWMWVWVNSGSWWWTGRPGVLRFMGSQRVGHDWVTELNWTDAFIYFGCAAWRDFTTRAPAMKAPSPNLWTTREFTRLLFLKCKSGLMALLCSQPTQCWPEQLNLHPILHIPPVVSALDTGPAIFELFQVA